MDFDSITLIPEKYKEKDPRALLYLYPTSVNIVAYAKKMQVFSFYQALEVAEDLSKRQGFILIPFSCIHWERAKRFGPERKIKIGRKSFFMLKPDELTKQETKKLFNHLDEIREKASAC